MPRKALLRIEVVGGGLPVGRRFVAVQVVSVAFRQTLFILGHFLKLHT